MPHKIGILKRTPFSEFQNRNIKEPKDSIMRTVRPPSYSSTMNKFCSLLSEKPGFFSPNCPCLVTFQSMSHIILGSASVFLFGTVHLHGRDVQAAWLANPILTAASTRYSKAAI